MTADRRTYDGGERPEPTGAPRCKPADFACPHCRCQLFEIEVPVTHSLLRGGAGVSMYLGCPACTFASRAMTVSCDWNPTEPINKEGLK